MLSSFPFSSPSPLISFFGEGAVVGPSNRTIASEVVSDVETLTVVAGSLEGSFLLVCDVVCLRLYKDSIISSTSMTLSSWLSVSFFFISHYELSLIEPSLVKLSSLELF